MITLPLLIAVEPDESTARRWLREELSKGEYANAGPSLRDRFERWLQNLLASADGLPVAPAVIAVVVIVIIVAVLILLKVGPLRAGRAPAPEHQPVFGGTQRSAADHRRAARELAEQGQWAEATQEAFRGLVRGLIERDLLDDRPGLTADEAARSAATRFPGLAGSLQRVATRFDAISFGGRAGDAEGFGVVTELDARLQNERPEQLVHPAVGLAVPR